MDELERFTASARTGLHTLPGTQISFGISRTRQVHRRVPGSHGDQFVISWILTGSGSFVENGKEYPLTDGCYCLRRPGKDFDMYLSDAPSCRVFFDLPDELYRALTIFIPELDLLEPVGAAGFKKTLLDEFLSLTGEFLKVPVLACYNLLPRLIHYILELTGIAAMRAESPIALARTMLEDTTSRTTLEEIADECGMKYDAFRKRFSATYGVSPGKYRINCRIEAAKNALSAGESVAEISERLGFTDVYTFTHRFKAEVGVSPAKYRNNTNG